MKKIIFFLMLGTIFIISSWIYLNTEITAQLSNDPNLDQIPLEYRDVISSNYSTHLGDNAQTDEDGFDNFFLGVNFAEGHISSNPRNPLQYFCAYNTNGTHYTMNGLDWYVNNPNFGASMRGDPVTAYDSLGRLYYENMYGSPSILGTRIIGSDNNSQSWLTPVTGNLGYDKNWIAADQTGGPYANNVYSVMSGGYVVRSTDRGISFQNVAYLANNLPGMMVAVGPNGSTQGGSVYVVTNSGSTFSPAYTFYRSTNGGTSFPLMSAQGWVNYVGTAVGGRNSVENMRTRPYPFIAADNSYGTYRGRLYCVFAKNVPDQNGAKPDIFCRYSTNNGVSWSSAVTINDDPNSMSHNQWHPAIWCDKETGRLYVHWMDTRDCPTSDSAMIYASYSDNGGASFSTNQRISTRKMKIDCSGCGGGGAPRYEGDYDSVTSNSKSAMLCWTDFRQNAFGSYVAYFPDFAMKINPTLTNVNNNGSAFITVRVPAVKSFTDRVKFTASVDTVPASGSLNFSFVNGVDSITSFPDSVSLKIDAVGSVTPGEYLVHIVGSGSNGTPVHRRTVQLLVNSSLLVVQTNRGNIVSYKVNGVTYNGRKEFVYTNGTNVTVQATSPQPSGSSNYIFTHWSNSGDTTQNIVMNTNLDLTAFYKIQYKLIILSSQAHTFGGNEYYDSATAFTFGVTARTVVSGSTSYYFRGWTGGGNGAYTSPDSSGNDSAVTWSISNPIVETVRWSLTSGITQLGSEIPQVYNLYQNYPNPFNPATKIRYDIVESGNVKVVVYDILGKEIENIVNQRHKPGKYEIDFNASHLPSGIFYYRITAGDFVSVKKMILLK
jgi:hypothetical protein